MLGVESQGQSLEGVLAKRLIVLAHVHKHALLVGELLVLLKSVVQAQRQRDSIDLRLGVDWLLRINGFIFLLA